ncbi:hypothetical protein OPKNFCMD_3843 [Methylobacterium crusticola]|uniref:DUF2190 family protein n=1 Tax=Methylobacterium crusticola TaxID=1697972 RepID=A0ABQ4R0W4_9HYPH|nr:DUF2190 family protein [Methylobacterium crusticola]GJD51092.1 hypothetical protein OPKNFCMD_3843 [Methylobacterium crusticola]
MRNFVQKGEVVTLTAPANLLSGDVVIVGAIFGVAAADALSGADVEVVTGGVYDLPKVSAQAWTQGAAVYWDATAKNATTTAGSNTKLGVAVLAAANPSAVGRVRLNKSF